MNDDFATQLLATDQNLESLPNPPDRNELILSNTMGKSALTLAYEAGLLKLPPPLEPFGSASWMKHQEIIDLRLNQQGQGETLCPYIGTVPAESGNQKAQLVFARSASPNNNSRNQALSKGDGHILTVGTTRSGKGSGQIIPVLLTYQGSTIVLDVKGENYKRTAGNRATRLKQVVRKISPFDKTTHIWNPILSIPITSISDPSSSNRWTQQGEEVALFIANLMISSSGADNDKFWEESAESFLAGLVLQVRTADLTIDDEDLTNSDIQHRVRERSMAEVRRLLTLERANFISLLEDDMKVSKWKLVREAAVMMLNALSPGVKTGPSIISMLLKQTQVWSFERVRAATYRASLTPGDKEPGPNDFNFSEMRDVNTTVYLIIPPEYLSNYSSFLRVIIGCAMRELKDSFEQSNTSLTKQDQPPVLFLLDEFPQLAYLKQIEDGLAYMAGYGVRFWFFIQDISQLKRHYKNSWQSFFSNTETKCFFGVNDSDTAKLISEMLGSATIEQSTTTYSVSNGTSTNYLNNTISGTRSDTSSTAYSLMSRLLMTTDEVLRMPITKQIISIKGSKHILADLPRYHESALLEALSEIPPPDDINS